MICCKWAEGQKKTELWLDGVEDYIEYANTIMKEFKDVIEPKNAASPASVPVPSTGLFNFGNPASSGGFGAFASSVVPSPAQVSGKTGPDQRAVEQNGRNDALEEQDKEGGEEDGGGGVVLDESQADILYKEKLQLLSQHPETKKWTNRGSGFFTVRMSKPTAENEERKAYIVFTADSGRVLINSPIIKNLKPTSNPKSPANVVMFLVNLKDKYDEHGSLLGKEEEKGMHLFKCGRAEVAQAMIDAVSEHS